ncbi:MAG: AraC family transcriptional regulator [Acidobacteriota bacterium]
MAREFLYRELPDDDFAVKNRHNSKKSQQEMIWIAEAAKFAGEGSEVFVAGCGWMFEIIKVESGKIAYIRDGKLINPQSEFFAVFYAPFSIIKISIADVKMRWAGIGAASTTAPASWMTVPLIFDLPIAALPKNADEMIEILKTPRRFQSIEINTKPSLLAKRAKKIIDENWLASPSIAAIARTLKVSHPHLTRQFKKDYGLAPKTYLHKVRLHFAIWKLSQGEKIANVSFDSGYNDLSRFYKQFRKFMKTSPGSCRIF